MTEDENKITHIVQQGENLGELTKYYTGGNNFNEVAQNNGISDPNKIYVGQEIEFTISDDSKYAQENPGVINNQEPSSTQAENTSQQQTTTTSQLDVPANQQSQTTTESETSQQQTPTASQSDTAESQSDAPANQQSQTATESETLQQQTTTTSQSDTSVSRIDAPTTANTNAYSNPRNFSNKWLCPSCPVANQFNVDKTHTDYYIGYLDSKKSVTSLNDSWKTIKSHIETLKSNIEALKKSIDSQDYIKQTNDIIVAIDNAIENLEKNFTALFNSVVNRLIEAAASDEWFSETAIEYATYISETILGKPVPTPQTNNAGANAANNTTEVTAPESTPEASIAAEPQAASESNIQTSVQERVSNTDAISQLGITEAQLDVVKATIRHEAGNNPDEMLVVASVIKNRMDSGVWGGTDAYSVTTAKGQFESYLQGYYKQYTGGNYYQGGTQDDVDAVSEQINAILTGNAAPLTDAERFRSGYKEGRVQYTPGGNYYF